MDIYEFVARAHLDAEAVHDWLEAGWLIPAHGEGAPQFSEIDLARALLIQDLRRGLGVNDEGVAIILDLVDQMHGMRRTLDSLIAGLSAQPDDLRQRIAADIRAVLDAKMRPLAAGTARGRERERS